MKKNTSIVIILSLICAVAAFQLNAARSNWDNKKNKGTEQYFDSNGVMSSESNQYSDTAIDSIAQEEDEMGNESSEPQVTSEDDDQAQSQFQDLPETIQVKRKKVIKLIDRAITYVKTHPISDAMRKFTQTKEFIDGELYVYVYDEKGVCLASGEQTSDLWVNQFNLTDIYGTLIIQEILNKGRQGGGWVTYNWRNATKTAYIQQVKKDTKIYTIGCGYYPHSKEDTVVNLVKGAVTLFNKMKAAKQPREEAFSSLSYPIGRFVSGDLYLYALDFKGNIFAQGDRPGLIGINSLDTKDSAGKFVNKEIINKLKERPDEGVWVEYSSKRARKRAYAERVVDNKGNEYFIACGYYPDENRDLVIDLVKKGYQYMKAHGKSIAAKDFSDRQNDTYRFGDLYLVVYDLKGKCIADGGNAENVGTNQWDAVNEDGRHYVREIIKQGEDGGGWVDFKTKNSFESFYVEMIDIGIDKYVIGCGIFPSTKDETVSLLLNSATSYFATHPDQVAFGAFTHKDDPLSFIRGDLSIFVINTDGLCFASGDDYNLIWQNILGAKDDDGKPYVKLFINTARNGAGKVTYKINKAFKVAYVNQVVKDGATFVIGSSYYR